MSAALTLAQVVGGVGGYSWIQVLLFVVIAIAAVVIAVIGVKAMGVTIPQWATQIFWVLVIAFVVVVAIILLVRLVGMV